MWLIYFCCYVSSFGTDHVKVGMAGRIIITADSVETYIYPHQYVRWKIDSAEVEYYDHHRREITRGIFYLSRPSGRSVLLISPTSVEQMVLFKNDSASYRDHISVKRREKI